ncbi:MAG: excinuclease ABC subunit A, partial [Deltaproteobacteria bacterium]|nr:excinuclease ABC subunit A [Deltaproteobacteria bacterium]
RQFLGQVEKPQVELLEGLSPAVSIDQKGRGRNPRSTVGTITEVHDHLRLLFARLGTPHCPTCGHPIAARSPTEIAERLLLDAQGQRVLVMAPVVQDRKGEYRKELKSWLADGYLRARLDGRLVRLEEAPELDRYVRHTIELVLDRLVVGKEARARLLEAIERAVALSGGTVSFLRLPADAQTSGDGRVEGGDDGDGAEGQGRGGNGRAAAGSYPGPKRTEDGSLYEVQATSKACPGCGFSLPELEPRLFSFNSPHGACPTCDGIGTRHIPSAVRVVPDPSLSLAGGALACLTAEGKVPFVALDQEDIAALARAGGVCLDTPWQELPPAFGHLLLHGSDGRPVLHRYLLQLPGGEQLERETRRAFMGVLPALAQAYAWTRASFLERWMDFSVCPACNGSRLKPEARAVRFAGRELGSLTSLTVVELLQWLGGVKLAAGVEEAVGAPLLREIRSRLGFLGELGLSYLTLDRSSSTLAGGEFQRIRLARQLGSRLQGVLYVLDEPSIGLHPRDNHRLIGTLEKLRDAGNTVLVVEHDEETLRSADHLVELGPGAGEQGGLVVAQGPPAAVARADTHSGRFLSGREVIPVPAERRPPASQQLVLRRARQHNLKGIDICIPLGRLVVVTGVSGSGKSTLVDLTLRRALAQRFHRATQQPGLHDGIDGVELLDKVIEIDQSPIGRTPRSNPATYTKVFDTIRDLFAALPEARARGWRKGRFSFNVAGGRCEECQGAGVKEVQMQLLSPVSVPCAACEGKRFNPETLEIRYRDRSITDVLEMTIEEARRFFSAIPAIARTLATLAEIGLGYLRLGQPSTTLSGGEAQRVKLAAELRRPATGRTLYILDEPTTGLHAHDVRLLLDALQRLVDGGNSVLVVEHNLEVIKVADHVIDLGPEGGEAGGELVAAGTPEEVAACPESRTGLALRRVLAAAGPALRPAGGNGARSCAARRNAALAVSEALLPYSSSDRIWAAGARADAKAVAGVEAGAGEGRGRMRDILVHRARQHNLKDLDVAVPGEKITVITGVSGSGKSSLAFHTLFAEGQRRYVESLSTYARRFLGRQADADVERIDGLAPAIAIDQKSAPRNPRSTVATVTEIHDHLRLLYARIGRAHCPACQAPLQAISPSAGARLLAARLTGQRVLIVAPWPVPAQTLEAARDRLRGEGIVRVRLADGRTVRIDGQLPAATALATGFAAVIDRVVVAGRVLPRLAEALETAYRLGGGLARAYTLDEQQQPAPVPLTLTEQACCPEHGVCLREPFNPRHFSFNHYRGACPACAGLGVVASRGEAAFALARLAATGGRPLATGRGHPDGDGDGEEKLHDPEEALLLGGGETCPECRGERLAPLPRAVRVGGIRLPELTRLVVVQCRRRLATLELDAQERSIAREVLGEIDARLGFLEAVGIGYLTLDRSAATLSGGEAQRIRLASQLGAHLSGCIYVLDEPTIGLHPRDTDRLLQTMRRLRDQGNTIVMVEHDLETIRAADHLIDLGPGAGEDGGRVVAQGSPAELVRQEGSLTGDFLAGRRRIEQPLLRLAGHGGLRVIGAQANNLKDVSASFPFGAITCVTGVSGSGKSSLVIEVLQKAAAAALHLGTAPPGPHRAVEGIAALQRLVVVDQSPIGRTPRSNPATYTGLLDLLRQLFAELPESQVRGYTPGRFSYNRVDGRCPTCEGMGSIQVEMHFLSDVWLPCDSCKGARYNEATLQIRYRGLTIAEVLQLRVTDAVRFFAHHRRIARICRTLEEVGLGYLRLGQAATTLSGGEAQRLKLAAELGKRGGQGTLYILDEPTTGLHLADVQRLLLLLRRLADRQAAVVVVEHNLEVIKVADHVVDLGPEAGDAGGHLVAEGTPEEVAVCPASHTGRYLRHVLRPGTGRAEQARAVEALG